MTASYETPEQKADRLTDAAASHADILGAILTEAQQQLRMLVDATGDAIAAAVEDGAYAQRQAWGIPGKAPEPVDDRDRVRLAVEGVIGGPRRPHLRLVHSSDRQPAATGPALPVGLTGRQQDVWLKVAAGRATATSIAESLGLAEQRVTRTLGELVAAHLVREVADGRYGLPSQSPVSVGSAS